MTTTPEQPTRFASIGRRQVIGAAAALVIAPAAVGIGYAAPGRQDATPGATPEGTPDTTSGTPEGTPAGTPMTAAGGEPLTVSMFDLGFDPEDVTIPADTDVSVTVSNDGALPHNWVIEGMEDIGTGLNDGGVVETITLNLPAGSYTVICTVPGHRAGGMEGILTVQ